MSPLQPVFLPRPFLCPVGRALACSPSPGSPLSVYSIPGEPLPSGSAWVKAAWGVMQDGTIHLQQRKRLTQGLPVLPECSPHYGSAYKWRLLQPL